MPKKQIVVGDLVVFDRARMTHRGGWSSAWDLKAAMMVIYVPPSGSASQIALVLMNGKPTSVGMNHLKLLEEE